MHVERIYAAVVVAEDPRLPAACGTGAGVLDYHRRRAARRRIVRVTDAPTTTAIDANTVEVDAVYGIIGGL